MNTEFRFRPEPPLLHSQIGQSSPPGPWGRDAANLPGKGRFVESGGEDRSTKSAGCETKLKYRCSVRHPPFARHREAGCRPGDAPERGRMWLKVVVLHASVHC